jgi:uncharacterized protein YhdP
LTEAQGDLAFTADTLQAKNLRARLLDHPMTLDVSTLPGGTVRVSAAGALTVAALRAQYGLPLLDHLSGETPWRAVVTVKRPNAEVRV